MIKGSDMCFRRDSLKHYTGRQFLAQALPIGPKVVPFWGSYVESYKVIPKRNYYGAYG